jgi:TorA maturation chaperone TorD
MSELLRALGALAEAPAPAHARIAQAIGLAGTPDAAEHTDLFGFQLYPYASVYLGAEGMLGGDARDRVAGFWSAIGELPPAEPDHVTVLLAQLAAIHEREGEVGDEPGRRILRHARQAFFREHIASWIFAYLARVQEVAPPFYRGWADAVHAALVAEAGAFGAPSDLPSHLRDAPALTDADVASPARLAAWLLAPVRSGVVLTRGDLAGIAGELGVGARMGERRATLEQLFAADAAGTRARLAREARRQAERYRADTPAIGAVAGFWAARAEAAADALDGIG